SRRGPAAAPGRSPRPLAYRWIPSPPPQRRRRVATGAGPKPMQESASRSGRLTRSLAKSVESPGTRVYALGRPHAPTPAKRRPAMRSCTKPLSATCLAALLAASPAFAGFTLIRTYDVHAAGDEFGYSSAVIGDMDGAATL